MVARLAPRLLEGYLAGKGADAFVDGQAGAGAVEEGPWWRGAHHQYTPPSALGIQPRVG